MQYHYENIKILNKMQKSQITMLNYMKLQIFKFLENRNEKSDS